MLTITEEMRESARKLLTAKVNPRDHYGYDTLLHKHDRDLLTAIANGKRKLIDGQWWKEMHRECWWRQLAVHAATRPQK